MAIMVDQRYAVPNQQKPEGTMNVTRYALPAMIGAAGTAIIVASGVVGLAKPVSAPSPVPSATVAPSTLPPLTVRSVIPGTAPVRTDGEPLTDYYPDCEDDAAGEGLGRCVTTDEGGWRLVVSYHPYRYRNLNVCATEDGSPIGLLPCVWDSEAMGNGRNGNGSARRYIVYSLPED
jgi:hypothetical protein